MNMNIGTSRKVMGWRRRGAWSASLLVIAAIVGLPQAAHAQYGEYPFDQGSQPIHWQDGAAPPMPHDEPLIGEPGGEFAPLEPYWDPEVLPAHCGYGCPTAWQVQADVLWLNYESSISGASFSNSFRLDDFNYDPTMRITINRHWDCLDGWEFTFVGPMEWHEMGRLATGNLHTPLVSDGIIDLSTFNNVNVHEQSHSSKFNSFEANRRWWGWDVISTYYGVRYLSVKEEFVLNTEAAGGARGRLEIDTDNDAFGVQLGMDLRYPLGRLSTMSRLKGTVMANITEADLFINNAGVTQINNSDDDVAFASIIELGYFATYRVTPRISLRGGYEMWWIYGMALANEQGLGPVVSSFSGSRVDDNGDVFYHGGSAGVEVVW